MAIALGAGLGSSYDNVDRNSYTFTVTTPTTGRVAVLFVGALGAASTTPTRPTPSGLGFTWTFVAETIDTSGTVRAIVAMWTGVGTGSGTTLTVDFGGVTHAGCAVSLADYTGVDTTTPIVQSGVGTGATGTGLVTLGAAPTSAAVVGGFTHLSNEAVTAGTSFTLQNVSRNGSAPSLGFGAEYQLANDQTVDMTWATTSTKWRGVAAELRVAAAAGVVSFGQHLGTAYNNTDVTEYGFGIGAPTVGRQVAVFVSGSRTSANPNRPTLTGCGLTWLFIAEIFATTGTDRYYAGCFIGVGTADGGNGITVTWPDTMTGTGISTAEFINVDQISPTIQSVPGTATGTGLTLTLEATPTSAAMFTGVVHAANEGLTEGPGWTLLSWANSTSPSTGLGGKYQMANDASADWTWTTSSVAFGVLVELAAARSARRSLAALGVS